MKYKIDDYCTEIRDDMITAKAVIAFLELAKQNFQGTIKTAERLNILPQWIGFSIHYYLYQFYTKKDTWEMRDNNNWTQECKVKIKCLEEAKLKFPELGGAEYKIS